MSLTRRSVTSSAYSILSNIFKVVLSLGRSIALSRLLTPDIFGLYAFVTSTILLSQSLPLFGLRGAFLYKTIESKEEEEKVIEVYFTLLMLFSLVWAMVATVCAVFFAPDNMRYAFGIVIATTFISLLTQVPHALLVKRVMFRRLAVFETISVIATTIISVGLAWFGFGLWSLLATNIVTVTLRVVILYGIRPVWLPRLGWSRTIARYFLSFGSKMFVQNTLAQALDRVDDISTGLILGDAALGFYSRAYKFANYPRMLLALPLNRVAVGVYAQLQGNREKLSRAFSGFSTVVIRVNFLLAGVLTLIAPEFIRLVLGVQWLPMLDAFRLMLIYTLLDPIKFNVASVISSSGAPERVSRARLVQLAVMLVGLVTLGPWLGIAGIALAVDLMLVVGIFILFYQVREYVNLTVLRLFTAPTLALVLGLSAVYIVMRIGGAGLESDWLAGIVKASVFSVLYVGAILILERKQIPMLWGTFKQLYLRKFKPFRSA